MYYPDLTPYVYIGREDNTVNIGWLDILHSFDTGVVSQEFIEKLKLYRSYIVQNCWMGAHTCEFCRVYASTGELRIFGLDERIYATPTMVVHYVIEHQYLPPQEFVDAVLRGPHPPSQEYKSRAQWHKWAHEEDRVIVEPDIPPIWRELTVREIIERYILPQIRHEPGWDASWEFRSFQELDENRRFGDSTAQHILSLLLSEKYRVY
jgi:hypothetical protein